MSRNHHSNGKRANSWQQVTELRIIGVPGCETEVLDGLAASLSALQLPDSLFQKLRQTLAQAIERCSNLQPGAPLLIRVYVVNQPTESAPPSRAPNNATGWGFFLTEKKIQASRADPAALLHALELFCYQDG